MEIICCYKYTNFFTSFQGGRTKNFKLAPSYLSKSSALQALHIFLSLKSITSAVEPQKMQEGSYFLRIMELFSKNISIPLSGPISSLFLRLKMKSEELRV